MNINSLNNVLNVAINKNEENEIPLIKHSPYVNTDELISFCVEKANNLTIISLNVQSLNAKFDQIQKLSSQLKSKRVQFNAICLQETWLTENSDLTSFQIPGYTLFHKVRFAAHMQAWQFMYRNIININYCLAINTRKYGKYYSLK